MPGGLVPVFPGEPTPPQLVAPLDPPAVPQDPSDDFGGPSPSLALLADRLPTAPAIMAYGCEVSYEDDLGIRTSPVAGPPGTPAAEWRCHGGIRYKTVTFVAQASGGKPELPSPYNVGPNEKFLARRLSPQVPQIGLDGKPIWTIGGKYIYRIPGPYDADGTFMDNYDVGSHPLSILPPEANTLNINDFGRLIASAQ